MTTHLTDAGASSATCPASDSPNSTRARLSLPGWDVRAEVSQNGPQPMLSVWAQDPQGWPGGESSLDAVGVDELLTALARFSAQLRALRTSLGTGTAVTVR